MVRTPQGEETLLWDRCLFVRFWPGNEATRLGSISSFTARRICASLQSAADRGAGAPILGCNAEPAPAVPGRKAHKSQRGPVQASIGVVRCNVRGAATADALLVIEDKREARSLYRVTAPRKSPGQCCASLSTPQQRRALHHLL